jgi:hypothetical protein
MRPCVTGYNWLDCGEGNYLVLTPEHKQYTVDLNTSTCSCPRFQYLGGAECKHLEYIRHEIEPKPEKTKARREPIRTTGRAVEDYEARMRANITNDFA